ncbi:hypothetical protein BV898_12705 [Hypsibius exemplaris]|uniref:Uncharacterized protein n=1 Tax=Hypsibius exemplaris TaxID=2072580 RepID=A0A1W0WD01_HYPEX|nr:hypothetical protein BV898_12705 [Hypsibius exemplaris]
MTSNKLEDLVAAIEDDGTEHEAQTDDDFVTASEATLAKAASTVAASDNGGDPAGEGCGIDEDHLFNAASEALIPRHTYDVYSLRSDEPDIYRKIAAVLHDMTGMVVPEFILQILQLYYEGLETDEDTARRLYFDIDNKILKSLQAMRRAQICDRVKGFDLKLAKVMSVLSQHYLDAVKTLPEDVLEELIPRWPDDMYSLPADGRMNGQMDAPGNWKIPLPTTPIKTDIPAASADEVSNFNSPVPVNYCSASTMASSVGETMDCRAAESKVSTCAKATTQKLPAFEYGLVFDVFAPETGIFSIYMNPKVEYTVNPKDAPIDPDYHQTDGDAGKGTETASQVWRQVKRISGRVTRSLKGF